MMTDDDRQRIVSIVNEQVKIHGTAALFAFLAAIVYGLQKSLGHDAARKMIVTCVDATRPN